MMGTCSNYELHTCSLVGRRQFINSEASRSETLISWENAMRNDCEHFTNMWIGLCGVAKRDKSRSISVPDQTHTWSLLCRCNDRLIRRIKKWKQSGANETHSICRINYSVSVASRATQMIQQHENFYLHSSGVWRSSTLTASALSPSPSVSFLPLPPPFLAVPPFGSKFAGHLSTENKNRNMISSTRENYLYGRIPLAHELIVSRLMFVSLSPSMALFGFVCFFDYYIYIFFGRSTAASLWTIINLSRDSLRKKMNK